MNKTQKILSITLLTLSTHAFAASQSQGIESFSSYDLTRFNFTDCKTGENFSDSVKREILKQNNENFIQVRMQAFDAADNRSFYVRPFAKGYLYAGIGLSGLYCGLRVAASYGWNILKYPLTALGVVAAANYFFEDKVAQIVDNPEKLMAGAAALGGVVGLVYGPRDVEKSNRLAVAGMYEKATGELLQRSFGVCSSLNALQKQAEQNAAENKKNQELVCAAIETLKQESQKLTNQVQGLNAQVIELTRQTGDLKKDGQVAMGIAFDNIYKNSFQMRIGITSVLASVMQLPDGGDKEALLDQCFGLIREFMCVYQADQKTVADLCRKYPALKNSNYSDSIDGFDNSVKTMSAYLLGPKVPQILSTRFKEFQAQQLASAVTRASSIVEIKEMKKPENSSLNCSTVALSVFNSPG